MKFRKGVEVLSLRMTNPTTEFDFHYPKTELHQILMNDIQLSLKVAWELARDRLPEMDQFKDRKAWVFVDPPLIVEPETPEERTRLRAAIEATLRDEDGVWALEEAFTSLKEPGVYIVIGLNSFGPTPYGARILHELLHHLHLDEATVNQKLSGITAELVSRGLGEPYVRAF